MSRPRETATVRSLNDAFRRTLSGGDVLLTPGLMDLGPNAVAAILDQVRGFDDFDAGNDPDGEGDFGAFAHGGERLFWKIDCYDRSRRFESPDPADACLTARVLTVMLAEEY